jgi:ATP-dependent helicase/nuclease subunit B
MVLRALLQRHAQELKLFRGSARRAGFAQELGSQLAELQQHQFTPARLRELAAESNLRRELRDKLHDLALLAEKYADWLRAHDLQDANHLLDFATDASREQFRTPHSVLRISSLWLDGFAEMTPQELDLLAAILPFCEKATLAFCLENEAAAEASWLSIWSSVGKTFQQCRRRTENLPGCEIEVQILKRDSSQGRFVASAGLAQLESKWAQPVCDESAIRNPQSVISIHACAHPEAEAVFAAREILKFVRAGNRFRDCAILVRNLDNYHQPLARVFRRYEIPIFLDRRESVAHHALAELTRSALRAVAFDWQHNDWFAALKAGFCPVAESEIDRLENAALEFGWRGKKWRAPLPDEFSERLRQNILPPFESFSAQLDRNKFQPTGAELAAALRELWNDLNVEQTLERWTSDEGKSAIRNPQSGIHQTVWEQMNSWLDNLALAFPSEPLSLRDWLPVVEAGLAGLTVGVIPPVLDEVLIGAIDRARNPDLKLALVLGMNESVFPAAPAAPIILTDADRDELEQSRVTLGPDLRERLSRERFLGYIACTRASEKLAVTFSRHDADGRALNPSPFIAHLQRLFPKREVEEFQDEISLAEVEHASELVGLLVNLGRSGRESAHSENRSGPTSPVARSWDELLELPAIKSLLESLQTLREPDPAEKLSRELAEKTFSTALQTSVSRLEEFAQCPFKFFVRSGLLAGERKLFELDARERGSFQHEVLKIFHDELAKENKRWRNLTPTEARERVTKIAANLADNFHEGLMRDTAQTRFEARALTEALQDFVEVIVTWMHGQYEFAPAAAELDFGGKNSSAPAWDIDLGGGHTLALQGRIDRVDLWRESGERAWCVVMDYKSGGKKLDALLLEHGVQLQLPAYLNALRHWKNPRETFGVDKLIPAGVFYVNLRGRFESGKTRDEVLGAADAQKLAYRHNGRFDAGTLDKLDRIHAHDQFNYRLNQDGSLRKGSTEALPRAEFEAFLDGVETRLQEMGDAIFSGEAKVDPYRKGAETPCEFCNYRAVCRIDPWTHQWRVLRAASTPCE